MRMLQCAGLAMAVAMAPPAGATAATVAPQATIVHIKDFKYGPMALTVHLGTHVRFINDDDEAHTVTSTDKLFDSEGLDSDSTWDHVFTKTGTFTYFCELHPYMKGKITVIK